MVDSKRLDNEELLREALLDLDNLRKREESARREAESLLRTLELLTNADSTEAIYQHLLNVLKKEIGFEEAFVLREHIDGALHCEVATADCFAGTVWQPQKLFSRVLDGATRALFDVKLVPEWQAQGEAVMARTASALMTPVRAPGQRVVLVGTHAQRGIFANESISRVKRYVPLIEQTLINAHSRQAAALQDKLEHEKRLALRASEMKDSFLSSVSHELRTPMNAILGFTELLLTDPDAPLTDVQDEFLTEVKKAGNHLLQLINQILDIGRIESGRLELAPETIELNAFLSETLTMLEAHAETYRVEIQLIPQPDAVLMHTDPFRLRQVMINLINNGVKYNQPGGRVRVEILPGDSELCMQVTDDGIGMSPQQLEHIFEPFARVSKNQHHIEGSGMGLAIVKKLVVLMKGRIDVESQEGAGSCFSVTFHYGWSLTRN